MRTYRYRLVNVFTDAPLAGNALCVFEDARGLDDETMQGLALQFNLSETTFVLPSATATAQVRIFTPTFEMPFAGHPTLGTAQVVRSALGAPDALTLEMRAGIIPVTANGDVWTLRAQPPKVRPAAIDRTQMAQALQLAPSDIASDPLWVDTGAEQLIVPLVSIDAVRRAQPDAAKIGNWPLNNLGRAMCYVWAYASPQAVESRFFFTKHGSILEDPGTGSACANLGGWLLSSGQTLPVDLSVAQGAAVGRPCRLGLSVTSGGAIMVSG
ncbi:MAG: PhzF family phenazine biosynthesis protein, partial [Betaproteobacteria bacterium]